MLCLKGLPTFLVHLRLRSVSRRNSRRRLVGGVTHHKDPLSKYALKAVSIISSHSGNKTEAFPARDPHTDQTGLT